MKTKIRKLVCFFRLFSSCFAQNYILDLKLRLRFKDILCMGVVLTVYVHVLCFVFRLLSFLFVGCLYFVLGVPYLKYTIN